MYSPSVLDSATPNPFDKSKKTPLQRHPSTGSLTSESSSSSLETPISYATDPDDHSSKPAPRTTRQKVDRRPPSSFYLKKPSEMTWDERICDLASCPPSMHELKDETLDRGPIPVQPQWKENAFVISHGIVPIALQQLSYWAFPSFKWPLTVAYPFYVLWFMWFALQVVGRMNYYCVKFGTFDEKQIGRDRTPDKSVRHLAIGVTTYMFVRTGFTFYLHYYKEAQPLLSFTWMFPLKLAAWEITLDYFFYCYHRASHDVDWLWFIHKHHHTTKHPTAILASTSLAPYVEMLGHSGVRAHWTHPVLFVLEPFEMGLAVEDHDIHHRFGKSGKNYCKQTRIFDKLFGTCAERIETFGM
ncbi:SPOSA6832_04159 [Sporobolomyces salmonicolor]|uniref:SPOSA6832_04159-mRNA-1:cds n=1 Tax=Sporidiobolus salmonicolor TaxID=5005 RepID=A0A0D6ERE4_SPOSA|nr:SPOSA6832_04159 [Sporobolomyces salmonicolor]